MRGRLAIMAGFAAGHLVLSGCSIVALVPGSSSRTTLGLFYALNGPWCAMVLALRHSSLSDGYVSAAWFMGWLLNSCLYGSVLGWVYTRLRPARATGVCLACGYDLRASAGACPECGAPRVADPHKRFGPSACPNCGYEIRGSVSAYPKCGTVRPTHQTIQ